MNNHQQTLSPEQLEGMIRGWQSNRILLTAFELSIFAHLENPTSSDTVAAALNTSPRHTDRLLNALVVLGVIEKKDGKFKNGSAASKHLVPGKPEYWMSLGHLNNMWDGWTRLTDVIRTGKPARELPDARPGDENWAEHFIATMQQFGSKRAPAVFAQLELNHAKKAVDLGGGSGAFAVEVARRYPSLHVDVFDLPHILPITKKYVTQSDVSERIGYVEGDFLVNDYGTELDVVFMSNVIHSNGPEEVQGMFRRAFKALNPGGQLVIHDFMPNDDRTAPPWAVTFAINMLVHTKNGDTFTINEIKNWMEVAGFTGTVHKDTGMNSDLVIAHRPK